MIRRVRLAIALLGIALVGGCRKLAAPPPPPSIVLPSTGHPRLWVRAGDLARLRGWARRDNPAWTALAQLGADARRQMDAGTLASGPGCMDDHGTQPCEEAAELFAFLSLVSPEDSARHDYGARAHKLLLQVMDTALRGDARDPLRDPRFAVDDRSRWSGEALPLVVDWIYPLLSAAEKQDIGNAFARFSDQIERARVTTLNHPEPPGVNNTSQLLVDAPHRRWAGNNYFTAHARNLALMALAFDAADDSERKLAPHLESALRRWLYLIDQMLQQDARGGLPADGLEYGPQSLAYVTQLLLALHTSGVAAQDRAWQLGNDPFWNDLVTGWMHLQSPGTTEHPWLGAIHQPMWWGDCQHELGPDGIDLLAPIALYDADTGNRARAETIRWIERELPPGTLAQRLTHIEQYRQAILYFLLLDPTLPAPRDPRPSLPTTFFAPGVGRLLARSDWSAGAAWLGFGAGWSGVDHQHGDAGSFDFYRQGEWLTKERSGYGQSAAGSDWHNTLAIENEEPFHAKRDANDYRAQLWRSGSQWFYGADGDGKIVAHSESPRHVFVEADTTALYNSREEASSDVQTATRALLWLIPDRILVIDHAVTKSENRFKRFHLQLPAVPALEGGRAVMTTARGQRLYITTLAPADATPSLTPLPSDARSDAAELDPIRARFTVESRARDVRFVHLLQAAGGVFVPEPPQLLAAGDAVIAVHAADTLIVVPLVKRSGSAILDVPAPRGVTQIVCAGLDSDGAYTVELQPGGRVHITNGGSLRADGGGVLWWSAR